MQALHHSVVLEREISKRDKTLWFLSYSYPCQDLDNDSNSAVTDVNI